MYNVYCDFRLLWPGKRAGKSDTLFTFLFISDPPPNAVQLEGRCSQLGHHNRKLQYMIRTQPSRAISKSIDWGRSLSNLGTVGAPLV
jgi:hypothetical protein